MLYKQAKQREIVFPLGGLGSGCVGLTGWGGFKNIEIFGKPNKETYNGYTHFAVRTDEGGKTVDCRVLNGDIVGSNIGYAEGMGSGLDRRSMGGFPHFKKCTFDGQFPVATLTFEDEKSPLRFRLKAWNPFIPLDSFRSSLPAAFFEWEAINPTSRNLTVNIGFSLGNSLAGVHKHTSGKGKYASVMLGTEGGEDSLCIGCDCADTQVHSYWLRGDWFDSAEDYWQAFSGQKPWMRYDYSGEWPEDHATLVARMPVAAGGRAKVRFVLAWYIPDFVVYDMPVRTAEDVRPQFRREGENYDRFNHIRKYYATKFSSAEEIVGYALKNYREMFVKTDAFRRAIFTSSVPQPVREAVSRNLAILKSSVFVRLSDGFLYGYEGTTRFAGSCPGNCSHVYNYSYALAYLFPDIERQYREAEFIDSLEPNGKMNFRVMLPRNEHVYWGFRACCDGQFGAIIKLYRDWLLCGDKEWLKGLWPNVKKAIAYAWSKENPDKWDSERSGILWGRQHETLDTELFGPNSWLTGMYSAALWCASKMAATLGDGEAEKEYAALAENGRKFLNEQLFNGEYFYHKIDIRDKSLIEGFGDAEVTYWFAERGELKYQIGEGCGIDQVLAGYHMAMLGEFGLFEKDKLRSALLSVYRYNFVRARDIMNPCRIFSVNDERGVIIVSYPPQADKPIVPCPYAQETMSGFEYQFAAHMVFEGLLPQALSVVQALQERYDGSSRNPYSEIECGNDYVRSLASFSLLNAYSGMKVSEDGAMTFRPQTEGDFSCFCCNGREWGMYERKGGEERFRPLGRNRNFGHERKECNGSSTDG